MEFAGSWRRERARSSGSEREIEQRIQPGVAPHLVPVPATLAGPQQKPFPLQVRDDPLDGALGDSDAAGHVPQPDVRFRGDHGQDARVVGEEGDRHATRMS